MTEEPDKRAALADLKAAVKGVIAADLRYCAAAEQFATADGMPAFRRLTQDLSDALSSRSEDYRKLLDLLNQLEAQL